MKSKSYMNALTGSSNVKISTISFRANSRALWSSVLYIVASSEYSSAKTSIKPVDMCPPQITGFFRSSNRFIYLSYVFRIFNPFSVRPEPAPVVSINIKPNFSSDSFIRRFRTECEIPNLFAASRCDHVFETHLRVSNIL